eukprot:362018-Chlamydomonas_euryale.AAC.19
MRRYSVSFNAVPCCAALRWAVWCHAVPCTHPPDDIVQICSTPSPSEVSLTASDDTLNRNAASATHASPDAHSMPLPPQPSPPSAMLFMASLAAIPSSPQPASHDCWRCHGCGTSCSSCCLQAGTLQHDAAATASCRRGTRRADAAPQSSCAGLATSGSAPRQREGRGVRARSSGRARAARSCHVPLCHTCGGEARGPHSSCAAHAASCRGEAVCERESPEADIQADAGVVARLCARGPWCGGTARSLGRRGGEAWLRQPLAWTVWRQPVVRSSGRMERRNLRRPCTAGRGFGSSPTVTAR